MATNIADDAVRPASISISRRTEVLLELAETASGTANSRFDAFATRLADALLRVSQFCMVPEQGKLHASAATLLRKNRYSFCYALNERLAAILHDEIRMVEDAGFKAERPAGALWPMDPDIEVDKKLCLVKAARAVEQQQTERLTALLGRMATLLGRDRIESKDNPFRAQVFLGAVHDAWCEFHPDRQAHHLVFPLLGADLEPDVGSILHALNTTLARHGIAPQPADRQEGPVAMDTQRTAAQFHSFGAGDRPLPGAFPSLMQDDAPQAAAIRDQFLEFIHGIYRSGMVSDPRDPTLLIHIRKSAPQGAITDADAHIIDLLIKVFEAVLANRNLPEEICALIATLQVPVLKAALADRDFFFREEHPARRTIELLARLGIGWVRKNGPSDPIYQVILRNIKRIHSDQRAASFADAQADIEAFFLKEESIVAQALSAPISQALQQEKMLQANKAARHDVALRIGTGDVVAFVEAFLEDKWVAVLTLAYSVKDEKPQAAENAVQTMDDLIWSVKPKITAQERSDMVSKLPGIIASLNKWLDAIQWHDEERVKFFSDLARTHASIARAPVELSPERQLEIAIEAAKQAAERRLQKIEQRQAEVAPDEFQQKVDKLERGTWMEFKQKDHTVLKLKLAWISPMRSLYIFSTRDRKAALSLSAEELAQKLRERRARVVLESGLVGRALAEALSANAGDIEVFGKPAA